MQPGQDDPYNPQQPPQEPGANQPPTPPGSYPPPPPYGQEPPQYGQQPPQYGQEPPQYGQQPPQYGQAPQYGQQPYGAPPPYGPGGPVGPSNTQGLVGMILGILSIPLACCPYLGFVLGVAGGVLGFLGRKKADAGLATNRGMALAGLICGAIGVVLSIAILILSFAFRDFDWTSYYNNNS